MVSDKKKSEGILDWMDGLVKEKNNPGGEVV